MKGRVKGVALAGVIALAASTLGMGLVAPAAQADEERLPVPAFNPCISPIQDYCIESVSMELLGMPPMIGVWVPSGQAIPGSDDTSLPPPTLQPTSSTISYPGRWSFEGFPTDIVGYDGIYVKSAPTSAGSDVAWIQMLPASARADGTVGRAVAVEGSNTPRDLSADMKLTAKIRYGPLEPTANLIAADATLKTVVTGDEGSGLDHTVTFSGYPTRIAQQKSQADCYSEEGVAAAVVSQMYAFLVFGNTRQSFGYDGMSGNLSVMTNGTCLMSTPVYDPDTGRFWLPTAAPHFAPDGVTVNRGFYSARIPLQDAALLFGLTDCRAIKAILEINVENENGEDIPVTSTIGCRKGVISVAVTGFQFSAPTISVQVKPDLWKKKYKKQAEKNRKKAGN